ncbi:MAG: DNA-directed RNA polymerase subunit H [Nanoarchaeota archaeon]|nr:DNA-directed RNA polymerase subunit H [Nanoarchaeota archaeon]
MTKKVDILQHELVPAYRVMNEEEINVILREHNIKFSQLPKIFVSDPIVERLEAKAGEVLEITRKSRTSGTAKHYRVIIDA